MNDAPSADDASAAHAEILAPSPLLTLAAFLAGWAAEWIWPTQLLPSPGRWIAGATLIGAGGVLFVGALRTMRHRGTHPAHANEPPELITNGVYQYSRNPIYTGHSLAHVGAALLVNSLWALVALGPVVVYLNRVIQREEAYLEDRFGGAYNRYREQVRRWI